MKDGFLTFRDLKFVANTDLLFAGSVKLNARMFFKNGYGVSVITGFGAYGKPGCPFELAVIEKKNGEWTLCYDTPITDDVIGYLTADEVTKHMIEVQKLEKANAK